MVTGGQLLCKLQLIAYNLLEVMDVLPDPLGAAIIISTGLCSLAAIAKPV